VRKTINHILAEYGSVALVVYFTLFFVVLLGAWAAIHLGWQPESVTGSVGAFTTAYLATKVTQPIRIASTLALTPLAARVYHRVTGKPVGSPAAPAPVDGAAS
jgi:hypothetical protein